MGGLCCVLFCLMGKLAYSQQTSTSKPAQLLASFPFKQYSGGVMLVKAKFENITDSLNFILDTGSGGISLDSTSCADLGIVTTPTDTTISGIGGKRKVHFVFNKTLHFPGLAVSNLNFHVNNYEVLTSVYGEKIDGIIGYSFFSRYIVHVNFDSLVLSVYAPGTIQYPSGGHLLKPAFTAIPIQYVEIKDRQKFTNNFYFDTGAGLCFLMSERFAADSTVLLKKRKPLLTQAEGMVGRIQMRLTVVKQLKIGPYKFRDVPTYLYKDDYNVLNYPFSGGLIGNELLRKFNMTINYPKREIHLMPNSHFNEQFDYAYTGLGIYFIEGKIMVEDVIEGSPAYLAGFKVGDELFSVGNNFSNNIQQYKNILLVPNQRLQVIVRREDALLKLVLFTKSIL